MDDYSRFIAAWRFCAAMSTSDVSHTLGDALAFSELNHYYLPSELEEWLHRFLRYYNQDRYHESTDNLTPADVYYGSNPTVTD